MLGYVVDILDLDNELVTTVCHSTNDLAKLISNLDENEYQIAHIETKEMRLDWKEFCTKTNKLETGDNTTNA